MLVVAVVWWLSQGGRMPASTPEQIHRLFEDRFNAGDLDGLMELYEPDAALIAQPGSLANGIEQARAALQGFLALKGQITLDTKLVVTVGELAYLANTWSLTGTEDVPSAVELRWRSIGDQAAASSLAGVTVASRAARRAGRCR
jgi:ketosteroid isomerase-like protein